MNTHFDTDTTDEFADIIEQLKNLGSDVQATSYQLAMLETYAESARTAPTWLWVQYKELLAKHMPKWSAAKVSNTVHRAKLKAKLGVYPDTAKQLIPAWLAANGYSMNYNNQFAKDGIEYGLDYVINDLHCFCDENKVFKESHKQAMNMYLDEQRMQIMRNCAKKVAFNPGVDPTMSELKKWVSLIVAPRGSAEETARYHRAAELVIANYIHRVKRHMLAFAGLRSDMGDTLWTHHTHCMPVLLGAQENGKTLAIRVLNQPLLADDLMSSVGFDFLTHDEKMQPVSYMPVLMFDELAGLGKQDVEKVKGIMTDVKRQFRKLQQAVSTKYVVSTFIGATNKCVYGLIKDETGNRRFGQFDTVKVDPAAIKQIDATKIWQSVDEQADAPFFHADWSFVKEIQGMERHKSPVEVWVDECAFIPTGKLGSGQLWKDSFKEFMQDFFPNDRTMSASVFARELKRLADAGSHPEIILTRRAGQYFYEIVRAWKDNVATLPTSSDKMAALRAKLVAGKEAR